MRLRIILNRWVTMGLLAMLIVVLALNFSENADAKITDLRIFVNKDVNITGDGASHVREAGIDLYAAIRHELSSKGFKVVTDPNKPHDLEAKLSIRVSTDTHFVIIGFETSGSFYVTITLESEGTIIDSLNIEQGGGRQYGSYDYDSGGSEFIKRAASKLAKLALDSTDVLKFANEMESRQTTVVKAEPAPIIPIPTDEKLPPLRTDTYAIVIGIDYEKRQDIPHLQYPSQDAKKVYDALTDARYGGVPKENAVLLLNEKATTNNIKSELRKIKNENGYVFVYFSGHGAPKTQNDKLVDGYLVPYDADISSIEGFDDTAIKLSDMQKLIDESQAKGVMIALDACFSGGAKSVVPKGSKPLVAMMATSNLIRTTGAGKIILTSSASNQQSWEDDKEIKGGIFSHFLIEGINGKAGEGVWVKADELADYVKMNVPKTAKRLKGEEQTPQIIGKGDFAVARNWEREKTMAADAAKTKLKTAMDHGAITAEQLSKAMDELKTLNRSKTLGAFIDGKIDEKVFGELY